MSLEFDVVARVAAPPGRVFAALSEADELRRWRPGLLELEPLGGGAPGPGYRYRERRRLGAKEQAELFEITAFEPPGRLELYVDGRQGSAGQGEVRLRYELAPDGRGTDLRLHVTMEGLDRWTDVLARLFAVGVQRALEADLAALRQHLEQAPLEGGRSRALSDD